MRHDGVKFLALAELRGGFKFAGVDGAVDVEGAELFNDAFPGRRVKHNRGMVGDMIVEVAAYQGVRVWYGGGAEQDAAALDGAGADDEVLGGEGEFLPRIVEDTNGGDAFRVFRVQRQAGYVGVREDGDPGVSKSFSTDRLSEVAIFEGGPFGEADEDVARKRRCLVPERGEKIGGEGKLVYAEDALDFVVERSQLILFDGPREEGRAGWRGEDITGERQYLSTPLG